MKHLRFLQSAFFAVAFVVCCPLIASAEQLKIFQGDVSNPVSLSPGNELIVETDFDIRESAIANPGIADTGLNSATAARLIGKTEGRTTLTLFDAEGTVRHVEVSVAPNARNTATVTAPSMPNAQRVSVSSAGTSNAPVYDNGAIVIETDEPFVTLQFDDHSIAYGTALSDRRIYILGKHLGTTTLTLLRDAPTDSTAITIEVIEYED